MFLRIPCHYHKEPAPRLLCKDIISSSVNCSVPSQSRLITSIYQIYPGLIVDIYGDTAVMQAHSVGMHVCRMEIAKAMQEVLGDKLKNIYYKSDTTLPYKADINKAL